MIDWFLVVDNVINKWAVVGQFVRDRDISDHCMILLINDKSNWGPKPFKVNNEWFANGEFISFVENEWKAITVVGRGDYVLKKKL